MSQTFRTRIRRAAIVASVATVALSSIASAQAKLTPHPIGPTTAVGTDTLGALVVVRALSNGNVLVNDIAKSRVYMFDDALKLTKTVLDSTNGGVNAAMQIPLPSGQLVAYQGDSTLYVDRSTMSLLVLDPAGTVAHVMSLPKPQDALFIAVGPQFGLASVDPKGRLIYRGQIINLPKPPSPLDPNPGFRLPEQPDSQPVVRADFDTRKIDTVAMLKVIKPTLDMNPDKEGNITIRITMDPMDVADEWTALADGTVGIVRGHDYHVDWIDPDGTRRSSPKMPFDWKRMTDDEKQAKIDSVRAAVQKQIESGGAAMRTIPTPNGPRKLTQEINFPPLNKLGDFEPPIAPGSVRADLDNHMWITPRTAVGGGDGGLIYDVVNRNGEVVDRVQFPKGRALAGFGPGGVVYMVNVDPASDGKVAFLERATIK